MSSRVTMTAAVVAKCDDVGGVAPTVEVNRAWAHGNSRRRGGGNGVLGGPMESRWAWASLQESRMACGSACPKRDDRSPWPEG